MFSASNAPRFHSSAATKGVEHSSGCAAVNGAPLVCTCGAAFRPHINPTSWNCERTRDGLTADTRGASPRSFHSAIETPFERATTASNTRSQ